MVKRTEQFFVVTPPGFESICAAELIAVGLEPQGRVRGGVKFAGGLRELYLANLHLRCASRVLVRFGEVAARDFPTLFQRLARLPWGRYVKPGGSCRIRVSSAASRLIHTGRLAETCLAAISKALGEPSNEAAEGQTIFLRMQDDRCQVSIDSSGAHLHRRGYRQAVAHAPLRENLAAACLLACGYDGSRPLIDLMTGSGTFAIEAALIAMRRAPGRNRVFAFMDWPKYRPGLWNQLLREAEQHERAELEQPILAVDSNPKALAAACDNAGQLGLENLIRFECREMQSLTPQGDTGLLICNPPYGERLGKNATLEALYHDLQQVCVQRFSGWGAGIVCPEGALSALLGQHFQPELRFSNGGLDVALLRKRPPGLSR
ncbi:MAG: class I SAM-dependent RNA methyltransferase [Desulfuromonas sp.]|nr:MAG: class I SAM-dependent RNA methyltransferase [Desulfuromonas sp.]